MQHISNRGSGPEVRKEYLFDSRIIDISIPITHWNAYLYLDLCQSASHALSPFPMLKTVTQLLNQSSGKFVLECHLCGTTVETLDDPCPACRSTEIAKYELKTERVLRLEDG